MGLFTEERKAQLCFISVTIQQYENQGTDSLHVCNDLSVHSFESTIH